MSYMGIPKALEIGITNVYANFLVSKCRLNIFKKERK